MESHVDDWRPTGRLYNRATGDINGAGCSCDNVLLSIVFAIVTFGVTIGLMAGARRAFKIADNLQADSLVAGAVLLPLGLQVLLDNIVTYRHTNFIIAIDVITQAYMVLLLYSGVSQVVGLRERRSAPLIAMISAVIVLFLERQVLR